MSCSSPTTCSLPIVAAGDTVVNSFLETPKITCRHIYTCYRLKIDRVITGTSYTYIKVQTFYFFAQGKAEPRAALIQRWDYKFAYRTLK
jgi:hypothetical protein